MQNDRMTRAANVWVKIAERTVKTTLIPQQAHSSIFILPTQSHFILYFPRWQLEWKQNETFNSVWEMFLTKIQDEIAQNTQFKRLILAAYEDFNSLNYCQQPAPK